MSNLENSVEKLEQQFSINYAFSVYFTRDVFSANDNLLASILMKAGKKSHKIYSIIDSGVYEHSPFLCSQIEGYAARHQELMQLCGPIQIIPGGEACKSQPEIIDSIITGLREHHLCRQSFVLAIGGGAVLDAAGYAAALVHRGLRLIRVPTTVLAQNDVGVGVKNAINVMGRKNFMGTFAPPFAVVNDFNFIDTLPAREIRAGTAEAVKVALIKDKSFFDDLCQQRDALASFDKKALEEMIYRCASIHLHHIGTGGDPFELGSARPLDFGHWSAHKLEEMTEGMLNHGEAVSIGMGLDCLYSMHTGMLPEQDLQQILILLADLGLPLFHPALKEMDIPHALDEFREHLGGNLAITLLTGIGEKKEVDRIDTELMQSCVRELEFLSTSPNICRNIKTHENRAELN